MYKSKPLKSSTDVIAWLEAKVAMAVGSGSSGIYLNLEDEAKPLLRVIRRLHRQAYPTEIMTNDRG